MKKLRAMLFLAALPVVSLAQTIPVKTVPVATGDQFLLFPSRNASMAGMSIALDDPLYDPFINPAKGVFIKGMQLLTSPVYYGISFSRAKAEASGTTLPLGLMMQNETFFGGLFLARQQLTSERNSVFSVPAWSQSGAVAPNETIKPNNNYTFVMGGKKLPGTDIAIGASIFWADLNALEGVQHLYANSSDIRQSGYLAQYRIGMFAPIDEEKSFEAVLMHHQFKMTHDVTYYNRFILGGDVVPQQIAERNLDETTGWAARIGYREVISEYWTLGLQVSGNWKWHPKIPNYSLMNIPRDPGNSSAYNFGIGLSSQGKGGIFSIEYIFEPILSNTWADADQPATTVSGGIIQPGSKTVENFFWFENSILRVGFHRGEGPGGFDFGVQLHSISYKLNQQDFVREVKRLHRESWVELTFTGGLAVSFPGVLVRYGVALTTGTGQPGKDATTRAVADEYGADFIPAPSERLTLNEAEVLTHQVALIIQL